MDLQIRRRFTVFQLMTILEENHHSLIFIEHDPFFYEDAQEMAEYISQALREAAREAAVLLYAPEADPYFEELVRNADRVFYFNEGPRAETKVMFRGKSEGAGQNDPRMPVSEETLTHIIYIACFLTYWRTILDYSMLNNNDRIPGDMGKSPSGGQRIWNLWPGH